MEQTATDIKTDECPMCHGTKCYCGGCHGCQYDDIYPQRMMAKYRDKAHTLLTENAELKERIMSAKSIRGEKWIIRWEGGDSSMFAKNAGFYAMHDNWEGGEIGPYKTMIEAMQELDKVLTEAK